MEISASAIGIRNHNQSLSFEVEPEVSYFYSFTNIILKYRYIFRRFLLTIAYFSVLIRTYPYNCRHFRLNAMELKIHFDFSPIFFRRFNCKLPYSNPDYSLL